MPSALDHIADCHETDEEDEAEKDDDGNCHLLCRLLLVGNNDFRCVLAIEGPDLRVHEETYSEWRPGDRGLIPGRC